MAQCVVNLLQFDKVLRVHARMHHVHHLMRAPVLLQLQRRNTLCCALLIVRLRALGLFDERNLRAGGLLRSERITCFDCLQLLCAVVEAASILLMDWAWRGYKRVVAQACRHEGLRRSLACSHMLKLASCLSMSLRQVLFSRGCKLGHLHLLWCPNALWAPRLHR